MKNLDAEKRAAAQAAVGYVQDGMRVGLGTGATAAHAVRLLGERVRDEGLRIVGAPTSTATRELAASLGIPLCPDEDGFELDIAIDGADEITRDGACIKGGGGALLHERIVAAAAERFLVIVDSSKLVERLGNFPLPVEVFPFGWRNVLDRLQRLPCEPSLRRKNGEPFRTDEGNFIIDCRFAGGRMPAPEGLACEIRSIAGVADVGLFLGMAERILVGREDGVEEIGLRK